METHECKEKEPEAIIKRSKGMWSVDDNNKKVDVRGFVMQIEEPYGDWIAINYCPFCGAKLV